jgi:hypothetical protein
MEFAIVCNEKGIVQEITLDTSCQLTIGNSLFPFVDSFSIPKILTFYQEIENKRIALNWEINFCFEDKLIALVVSGIKRNNELQIFGYSAHDDNQKIIDELSAINNSQSLLLRSSIKENLKHAIQRNPQSDKEIIVSLQNENNLLKNQVISSSRIFEKQLYDKEQQLKIAQKKEKELKEELLLIYDEIKCSTELISKDYQQEVFTKQGELEEIQSQLFELNSLLEDWENITE